MRFRLAWKAAENCLTAAADRANGTLARIHYLLGLVDRELYDYHAAKYHFTESMHYAWKSLAEHDGDGTIVERKAILTDVNIARCLALGLAWVHYAEGSTALAIPLLLAARTLLTFKKDQLIRSYVDVVYASALRSDQGDDPAVLAEVLRLLVRAVRVFRRKRHAYYHVRALHQLARAYIQRARAAQKGSRTERQSLRHAERHAKRVQHLSRILSDYRYASHSLIVRSQATLYRGCAIEAEALAREALELGYEDVYCRIEGLLARGAARLAIGNYEGACSNFEDALKAGASNAKVAALAHIFLSRGYALRKDMRRSGEHFAAWKEAKKILSTAYMRQLESDAIAARKQETQDFVVFCMSEKLDPRQEENRLHAFLAKWARARTGNDVAAIELLGISKQTYYNWQKADPKQRVLE